MKGSTSLSYEDPFDSMPDDNVKEVPVVEEVVVEPSQGEDGVEFSLTLKGRGTHQNRWVVVRFPDAETGLRVIKDPAFKELMDYSRKIEEYDAGSYGAAAPPPQNTPPNPAYAPQQSQEAPGGEKRFCSHGEMVFKTGVAKNTGKPYSLFSCTAPRESQCKAQFLK